MTTHSPYLVAALAIFLGACSSPSRNAAVNTASCDALAKVFDDQEQAFRTKAQTIRTQHLLLQDYDRQMIDAINAQRKAILATRLTELSVSESIGGCSGPPLVELRSRAHQEMANLRGFLNDFNRALKTDPPGVYIDQP